MQNGNWGATSQDARTLLYGISRSYPRDPYAAPPALSLNPGSFGIQNLRIRNLRSGPSDPDPQKPDPQIRNSGTGTLSTLGAALHHHTTPTSSHATPWCLRGSLPGMATRAIEPSRLFFGKRSDRPSQVNPRSILSCWNLISSPVFCAGTRLRMPTGYAEPYWAGVPSQTNSHTQRQRSGGGEEQEDDKRNCAQE